MLPEKTEQAVEEVAETVATAGLYHWISHHLSLLL